jgi:hypothetical protein
MTFHGIFCHSRLHRHCHCRCRLYGCLPLCFGFNGCTALSLGFFGSFAGKAFGLFGLAYALTFGAALCLALIVGPDAL